MRYAQKIMYGFGFNYQDFDDLSSEFIAHLFEKKGDRLKSIHKADNPQAYFRRTVRNFCIQLIRSKSYKTQKKTVNFEYDGPEGVDYPGVKIENSVIVQHILINLEKKGKLDKDDLTLLNLKFWESFTFGEINEYFKENGQKFSLNQIQARFYKCCRVIREELVFIGYNN